MKKLLFFVFCLSLFFPFFTNAQKAQALDKKSFEEIKIIEDTLGALGFLMVNDSLPEHRFASCKKFIPNLVKALKIKNSFNYPFERLNGISVMCPPDSSFRIFSWQLYVDKDTYHQYGAIQMNNSDLKLFRLLDRPSDPIGIEKIQTSTDEWLGAVYYKLHQFQTKDGPQYLLFGLDGHSFFTKRKIVDVLKFENGKPVFGSPVFVKNIENQPPSTQSRIILDYSAETVINLNYDLHLEMIIFDHLISQPSPFPGEEFTYLPDGSYEGYKYEDGQWVYMEKVFTHKYEDGGFPVPEPLSKKKDIFGNK